MPGLLLNGGVSARTGGFSSSPAPATATQAAFGMGSTAGGPSTASAIAPNDPFGVALWSAVLAVGLLIWIRHSLPK